ncbi:dihydropteroate synthase [Sinimarinibacterium sp. NLF-5-8]|uniref:dihydropteroate synthase n=1 Tax=Sinimarinibacterium sp. NLF-5-8 TaxID=2698684 RepID=UPI00137BC926|nr:dihydropteroate synthase [Sinimarinibacterium sp. NLF-5-8]QHS09547.1 dihydropteroate synthase [Sinimarinibacterium sp. NLF-5-8]
MGILNATPDSFSDGGQHLRLEHALRHALTMVEQGARIIDVGGESTRPGALPVSEQQELDRVIPVIEALRQHSDVVISVDTVKPAVMRAACAAGAELINDISALAAPGAIEAVMTTHAAVCLMHMQGQPRTMQTAPHYENVVAEVHQFLSERVAACRNAGVDDTRIVLDPGIGFGKTLAHNLTLLGTLGDWRVGTLPVLVGVSRKSMFGHLLQRPVEARLPASLTAAALALWQGAAIVRAHDVRETIDMVQTVSAIRKGSKNQ